MSEVAILVPVLGRPHRVRPLLESVLAATPQEHGVYFIAERDDDAEMAAINNTIEELELDRTRYRIFRLDGANYARKINHACALTSEPFVFTAADDLHFHEGWLERALEEMRPGVAVVGTNDLCNPRTLRGHSTHTLVARWYVERWGTIDEPGKVFHEGYLHEFVDDELVETAKARGMYAHAIDSIVEHLHPMCGKCADPDAGEKDPLYNQQRARIRRGRIIFIQRSLLWT